MRTKTTFAVARKLPALLESYGRQDGGLAVLNQSAVKPWSTTAPPEAGKPAHSKRLRRNHKDH